MIGVAFLLAAVSAQAAHTQARLLLSADTVKPGDTILAGVELQMDPGWHTYWQNSGASGMPTKIDWQLPPGLTAAEIQWPLPEKLIEEDLTTYIYTNKVILLSAIKLAPNLPAGPLQLKAKVSWLECAVQCVPGHADVQAVLNAGAETRLSKDSAELEAWQKRLPKTDGLSAAAHWEAAAKGDTRPLIIEWKAKTSGADADFFPDSSDNFEILGHTEKLPGDPGLLRIRKQVKKLEGTWPGKISGVLIEGSGQARSGYLASLSLENSAQTNLASGLPPAEGGSGAPSLGLMLLYAFLGGLILNVMPCVLPVIALKILGFVGQGKEDPVRARKLGLVYAGGVLASFLVLAGLVIAIKAAGHKAGWGLQFGSPYFLVAMTTLVTLIALNLFGVFEITLGGRALDTAASLSSKHGAAGAFFNGLLATVLATSCTAPLLGGAVGFALAPSQTALTTILMFLMVGVGLAFPYVVLTWQPGWLKFLPKPGPWMERFKIAMGFPMLAAAVWLFNLTSLHYGERTWWLAIFLVFIATAAWVFGEFTQRNRRHPGLALSLVIVVLVAGYAYALESHLRWREPILPGDSKIALDQQPNGIKWQPWSVNAVEMARAEGRPVLVDFTAKWCLTCNTIVKPALESPSVRKKVAEINAVPLLGDYTRLPDDITEELNRHGRAGVPLVLIYPKGSTAAPIVLPEALTSGMILDALDRASR